VKKERQEPLLDLDYVHDITKTWTAETSFAADCKMRFRKKKKRKHIGEII